jgi:hypothetical protein
MAPSFARSLGHERFGPEVLHRVTVPILELLTRGMYTDDTLLRNAQQVWQGARRSQPGKGEDA